jgi:hypothetical protein
VTVEDAAKMNMKQLALVTLIGVLGCHGSWAQNKEPMSPELEKRLKNFFVDKEAHARTLAKEDIQEQAPDVWKFFEAGKSGDWAGVASIYRSLPERRVSIRRRSQRQAPGNDRVAAGE